MLGEVWNAAEEGTFKDVPWLSVSDDDEIAVAWAASLRRYEAIMMKCLAWHRVAASLTSPLADCGDQLAEEAKKVEKRTEELADLKSQHTALTALSRALLRNPKPANFETGFTEIATWITKKLNLSFATKDAGKDFTPKYLRRWYEETKNAARKVPEKTTGAAASPPAVALAAVAKPSPNIVKNKFKVLKAKKK